MLIQKRGQSVLEYAILMVIIIAALITLQSYIKRGVQGRLKKATDDIGSQYSTMDGTNYYKRTYSRSNTVETVTAGVTATTLKDDKFSNTYEYINTSKTDETWN